MKVILTQDVRGKGKKGQMIEAAEGHRREAAGLPGEDRRQGRQRG